MSKYWEIVELDDGAFVLQSSDDQEPPLVRIEFSEEAAEMLGGHVSEIARAMIGAGVQVATSPEEDEAVIKVPQTVH